MNLGENIYRFRAERNMSQSDLADALDVSRQSVSKWENNSATPELEKLIRMTQIFGVTLDELAGLKLSDQSGASIPTEPKIIYIEKTACPQISKHTLIGLILLLSAFLYALFLNSSVFNEGWALMLASPVAVCGILFIYVKHPHFFCGWVAAAAYWLYILTLCHMNWEQQYTLLALGVALVIAMVIWSIYVHRKGLIQIPLWVWILGAIILLSAFILLWVNVVPPLGVSVTDYSAETAFPETG